LSIASILEKILILSGDVTTNKQERWVRAVGNGDFTDGVCTRIFGSTQNITIERNRNTITVFIDNLPGVVFQFDLSRR
jgi:hypothetical protein